MIINGGSRKNGAFFAKHLMLAEENEHVSVTEMRGFAHAENVPDAFRELKAIASGTQCQNYFYHANINTRQDEVLTPEQWQAAADALENQLHLTGQPRFIVEHEKEGRVHQHIVWGRIDPDTMTAISDSHNFVKHELTATELEGLFGHQPTERALTREPETERPEPNVKDWESFRAAESKIVPKAMKAELTGLWQQSDSGQAFAAALEDRGYILSRGDRRDFCVIDAAGDEHSLGRRIADVKAAEIRERMADVDAAALPSVAEGRELARQRLAEAPTEGGTAAMPTEALPADQEKTEAAPSVLLAGTVPAVEPPAYKPPETEVSHFDAIMAERVKEAEAATAHEQAEDSADRFAGIKAWWSNFREYVTDRRDYYRDQWASYFNQVEGEAPVAPAVYPSSTAGIEPGL